MSSEPVWIVRYDDGFGCSYNKAVFSTEQAAQDYVTRETETEAAGFPANYPAPYRRASYWAACYDIESAPLNPPGNQP